MKAIQISKPGGIDALEYVDVPIPKPNADEVLVKNEYVGINYIDTYPSPFGFFLDGVTDFGKVHAKRTLSRS